MKIIIFFKNNLNKTPSGTKIAKFSLIIYIRSSFSKAYFVFKIKFDGIIAISVSSQKLSVAINPIPWSLKIQRENESLFYLNPLDSR